MKQYERYKDSGIEWLGRVPEHWEVNSLKFYFSENTNINYNLQQTNALQFKFGEIVEKPNQDEKIDIESFKILKRYTIVKPNDIIINGLNLNYDFLTQRVAIVKEKGIITSAYISLCPNNNINSCFFNYFFKSLDNKKIFNGMGVGIRLTLAFNELKRIKIPIPPISEQEAIVLFLNQKCTQIDKAISQKEKVIELLNERRQIIIQRAVTRGINPNAKMKDSGIDWIGEIPEHWEIKRLKYLTSKIGSGVTPRGGSSVYIDSGIPLLRSQNIHFEKIDLSDVACISQFIDSTMSNTRVKEGDVLLNITGGSIGRCHYVKSDLGPANVNQHVCILRPYKFQTQYLYYLMRSAIGQIQIELEQTGGNREGLTFAALKNFLFPITSSKEQKYITNYLNKINTKIDKAISIKQQEIEKLKEYKTVLIDAAVTGKIKID